MTTRSNCSAVQTTSESTARVLGLLDTTDGRVGERPPDRMSGSGSAGGGQYEHGERDDDGQTGESGENQQGPSAHMANVVVVGRRPAGVRCGWDPLSSGRADASDRPRGTYLFLRIGQASRDERTLIAPPSAKRHVTTGDFRSRDA